jgi:hypothetical protein
MARASNAIAPLEEEDDETAMFVRPSDTTRVYTAGELRAILADTVDSSVVMLVPARKSDHPLVFEKRSCTLVEDALEEPEPPTMEQPAVVSRIFTLVPVESMTERPRARFAIVFGAILVAAAAIAGFAATNNVGHDRIVASREVLRTLESMFGPTTTQR